MLFLLQFTIEYRGLSQPDFLKIWIQEAEFAMRAKKNGLVKESWKVVGERKVYVVAEVESPEQMDAIAFGLPLMKEIGNQVQVDVTPVTEYHNFANFLETATGEKVSPPAGQVPIDSTKEGIFYWLTIQIGYSGMSQDELLKNWVEEARFAMKAQEADGDGLCLWKSIGKREIHLIYRVKTPEILDALSMDLPLVKSMGNQVQIECKSVRPYDTFYEEMKKRV